MSLFEKIYFNLPLFFQNMMISTYGYHLKRKKYGKEFDKYLKEFIKREKYTYQEWRDYQTIELRKLLQHAFLTVPYYNEKYKKIGFNKSKFQKFEIEDLAKLPYLEKEDLRKYGKTTLLSKKRPKGVFISSSGSTGTPTSIFYSNDFYQKVAALYEARVRIWAGVSKEMRRGMIGGKKIIRDAQSKPPFYRFNIAENQTYFSAYHISQKNLNSYVKGIIEHKVEYMVGYAMSNYFLADLIVKNNIKVPQLKAVVTSSEKLTQEMRDTFFKAYGCKTFDGYSGVEACGFITENQLGELLFSPDSGILEVLNSKGTSVNNGEIGEVVSTGLMNFSQPLIRYRIGDYVKLSKCQQAKSGLQMLKIDKIEGRIEDVIIGRDGRKMVRFHSLFVDIPKLKASQVIQHNIDDIEIKLITEKKYNKIINEKLITNRLERQLEKVNIKYTYVSDLPRTKNGKIKAIISKL